MDMMLQSISGMICYIDDILMTGSSEDENLENLDMVLQRLQQHNVRAKCIFLNDSVEFLGDLHMISSKVKAVQEAPRLKNLQERRSFLSLIHYYGNFLPDLSSVLYPLHSLLQAGHRWKWTPQCTRAFVRAKQLLVADPVLAHYDPTLPLKLAGDAPAYGIGAVLPDTFPDGREWPITFASRTLSESEQNYAQIEKEALSLVYGLRRFHQYLYGRKFTLVTDHEPLLTVLGPKTGISPLAAARLQIWSLLLSAYMYDIEYKSAKEHTNVDGLSHLPLPDQWLILPMCTFTIGQIQALPVTSELMVK